MHAAIGLLAALACAANVVVLPRAYSHNDYEHERPLFDALDRGFMGVEADVHLRGRELFVAHTGSGVKPGRTLRSLYLDPLLKIARANGGRVYGGGPRGFLLMVEFKSDANDSWRVLREQLEPYKEMLTQFTPSRIKERAVTVVITGHRPNDLLKAEPFRYAAIDGDLGDLDKPDPTLFPVISDHWYKTFDDPEGELSLRSRRRLAAYVAKAHMRGRKIRFYGLPNKEGAWQAAWEAGVDYINADDLEGLKNFLLRKPQLWRLLPAAGELSRRLFGLPPDPFRPPARSR